MNSTALVTGGARRLGKEIIRELAQSGYKIALHYNSSEQEAKELQAELEAKSIPCSLFQGDLAEEKTILNLISLVKKRFADLNLLINNASVFQRRNIFATELDIFNQNMNINFKAPFFLTRDFARVCKKGQVINIVDSKIAHNDVNYGSYALSKKVLADFTKMAAKELAPDIRVNGIAPGYILAPEGETEKYLRQRPDKIPLKRKGEPFEISKAISFLISNDYITGQHLYLDGGEHL